MKEFEYKPIQEQQQPSTTVMLLLVNVVIWGLVLAEFVMAVN